MKIEYPDYKAVSPGLLFTLLFLMLDYKILMGKPPYLVLSFKAVRIIFVSLLSLRVLDNYVLIKTLSDTETVEGLSNNYAVKYSNIKIPNHQETSITTTLT